MESNTRKIVSSVRCVEERGCSVVSGDVSTDEFPGLARRQRSSNEEPHVAMGDWDHVSRLHQFGAGVEIVELAK